MSKLRENINTAGGDAELPAEPDTFPYEVFLQGKRSDAHIQVGSVDAPNDQLALDYARETFGRRQACVHLWVVRRDHLVGTAYEEDFVERATDRSYREARGYKIVRRKWEAIRTKQDVDEYVKEDLKDAW